MSALAVLREHARVIGDFLVSTSYMSVSVYNYFVFISMYCVSEKHFSSLRILAAFCAFHVLTVLSLISYLRVRSVDGVSTAEIFPSAQVVIAEDPSAELNPFLEREIRTRAAWHVRTCEICKTVKPPRAHHCSRCDRCFLKFDHHCAIFGTCIEFFKYKFFVQFLFYNTLRVGLLVLVYTFRAANRGVSFRRLNSLSSNYLITYVLVVCEAAYNVYSLALHAVLISRNETSAESSAIDRYISGDRRYQHIFQEGPVAAGMASKNRRFLNPYNLGFLRNWKEVFGDGISGWFLPTFSSAGDGISFPKNREDGG